MKTIATLGLSLVIACSAFAQRTVTVNTSDVFTYPTATRLWGTNFSLFAWQSLTNSVVAGSNLTLSYDTTNRTITFTASEGGSVSSVFGRTGTVTASSSDYSAYYLPLSAGSGYPLTGRLELGSAYGTNQAIQFWFSGYHGNNPASISAGLHGTGEHYLRFGSVDTNSWNMANSWLTIDVDSGLTVFSGTVTNTGTVYIGTTNLLSELAGKQPIDSDLTAIAALPWTAGDLLIASNGSPARLAHPGSSGKTLISTNSPSGGWIVGDLPAGSGTVTSVGATSTVSGLQFSGSPITSSGILSLTGTVAAASIDSAIARLASPALTGDPTGPTASPGDSDTSLATTAFIQAALTAWTNWTSVTIGTLNVSTNLTVADVAYGAGWNNSTNVPSRNAVYDQLHIGDTDDDGLADKLDLSAAGYVRTTSGGVISTGSTSANMASDISDETGSGALVFGTGPVLSAPALLSTTTASALVVTNSLKMANLTASRGLVSDASGYVTNDVAATGSGSPVRGTSPTLTTPTLNGGITFQQVERQPHSSVTNYVADPSVSQYQIIYATNLVTKFLHLTNAAAGAQTVFLVVAGTNATVSVEIPSSPTWKSNTNKVSISAQQILPVSVYCYGSNNTNVVASMGQPFI